MNGFQCWFCGEGIDRDDADALLVSIENLWLWADGTEMKDRPSQAIYVHAQCGADRLAGTAMTIEPAAFSGD